MRSSRRSRRRAPSRKPDYGGRAASCPPSSQYLRHRLRRKLENWRRLGASPKLLRWIECGVKIPWIRGPPRPFHQGVSFNDMTPDQFSFLSKELPRLFSEGGMESGFSRKWVSRAFLVPKPPKPDGTLCWRIVVDLRFLNLHCKKMGLKLETLKRLRYLARPGDFSFSIDLADGFYALGLVEEDREFMTFEIPQALADACGFKTNLVQLGGLPMGWTLSPYFFCQMMAPVYRHFRSPMFSHRNSHQRYRRKTLKLRRRGLRILPFMDDMMAMCSSLPVALKMRDQVVEFGLFRSLDKRYRHTIDRFASGTNSHLPRFNSRWLEPGTEAVDCLRLPNSAWRRESNWCHPPIDLLDDLVLKLQRSGASATVVAPHWPDRSWHQLLVEMASELQVFPASTRLFSPVMRGESELPVPARWSVVVFRVPFRPGGISGMVPSL